MESKPRSSQMRADSAMAGQRLLAWRSSAPKRIRRSGEIARLDPHAADLDGNAEVDHVDVGVGDGDVGGGELELQRANLVQIAHGAVGDHADAAEGAMDVGLHLAPLGALAARLVEVVDDDDPGRGHAQHEVPPAVGAGAVAVDGSLLGADDAGGGVSDERTELGEEPADLRGDVPHFPRADLEGLDGIGDAGAGDLLEVLDLLGGKGHALSSLMGAVVDETTPARWCPCASR